MTIAGYTSVDRLVRLMDLPNIVAAKQLQAANERDKLKAKVTFQAFHEIINWKESGPLNLWTRIFIMLWNMLNKICALNWNSTSEVD